MVRRRKACHYGDMPTAPYPLARVLTALITAFVWFWVLLIATWVFAGGSQATHVSLQARTSITVLTLLLLPFFVAQSVHTNLLDGVRRGRVAFPRVDEEPQARSHNPWRVALGHMLVLGGACALGGYAFMSSSSRGDEASRAVGRFAWQLSQAGSVVALISAWVASGRTFVNEARVPLAARCVHADIRSYALLRHALPHGAINALINGCVAFALLPGPVTTTTLVPAKILVGDTVITLLILSALIAPAALTHARVDAEFRIAPKSTPEDALEMSAAVMTPLLLGFGAAVLLAGVFALTSYRPSMLLWACYRALLFGGYAGWIAARVSRAVLVKASAVPSSEATAAA